MEKLLKFALLFFAATSLFCLSNMTSTARADAAPKIKIVLAGDSTINDKQGWGPGFKACLDTDKVECTNMALNGRSSRSFRAEGAWAKCLALKPDFILIQFGHNDEPGKGPDRETDPETTYRANMNRYVDEARAAGIKPILVTSLSRRTWGDDGKIHSSLIPYVNVVKDIARKKGVPLIDLHQLSIALYEKIGKAECETMSPVVAGKIDNTHLNAKGGKVIGGIVATALADTVPALKPLIHTLAATAPSN
jgi:pectinesterase